MADPSPALVRRAQAGDRAALSSLVQSQQTYVYSIAMSLMHNPPDAADMAQEAFIRLMRSLGTHRAETKFTTCLYRLVPNILQDGVALRRRPIGSRDEASHGEGGEEGRRSCERHAANHL